MLLYILNWQCCFTIHNAPFLMLSLLCTVSWYTMRCTIPISAHNSFQMFEPFQNRKPHFFGTINLSWFVMKSIPKMYSFNLFLTKSLRISFNGIIFWMENFWGSYFQLFPWKWVFQTYMESNAAVTINFDPTVTNYLFFKDVCICWKNHKLLS